MDAETRYEFGKILDEIAVINDKLDKLDEMEDMEKHEALVEDRKPQLFPILLGKAILMDAKEALEAKM